MQTYRLIILRHGMLLGHFESSARGALDAIREVASRFDETEGYQLELLAGREERRILACGPEGVRVLSSEPVLVPVPLTEALPT